jgi:hypothetical protein
VVDDVLAPISWMSQRKLEYAFRLRMMSPDRVPRREAEAAWPMPAGGQCHERMHAGIVPSLAHHTVRPSCISAQR